MLELNKSSKQWPRYPGLATLQERTFSSSFVDNVDKPYQRKYPANAAWWSSFLLVVAAIFLIAIFAVLAVTIFFQPNSVKSGMATIRENSQLRQKISDGNYTLHITRLEKATLFQAQHAAAESKQLVAFEVSFENEAANSSKVEARQAWFSLQDTAGNKYQAIGFGKVPALTEVNEISASKTVTGWITFEVPINAQSFTLEYRPSSLESAVFSFKV